jgi:thiosulfate/3-mercaptopyruvate sulfurtransferase
MNNQFTVSPQWLSENINNPDVVIVDCRFSLADAQLGRTQYQTNHIPGAYYLDLNEDLSSPVQEHGGRHPLPNTTELVEKLSAIGVNSQKTLVVAYDDSRLAFASRLWWLLQYLGHEQVAVLDGGFSGWKKAGYAVTDIIPNSKESTFIPQLQDDKVVDFLYVKNHQDSPSVVLIDSREGERYRGEREPIDKIAGHIPGAVNYPWQEVTDASGCVIPVSEQCQRWQNIDSSQEVVVYCGSGITACVNLLSLAIAGNSHAKLYAGSWSDWISY